MQYPCRPYKSQAAKPLHQLQSTLGTKTLQHKQSMAAKVCHAHYSTGYKNFAQDITNSYTSSSYKKNHEANTRL